MTAVRYGLTATVGLMLAAVPQLAEAQPACAPRPVARIESVKNSVRLVQAATRAPVPATRQVAICAGDTIQVGDNSRAVVLMLESNTPLVIDQNSEFVVTEAPTGGGTFVDLVRGALLFITRVRRSIEIRTPFVNAAIEGTEFVVRVQADRTVITVLEGVVRATNPQGMVNIGAGQQAVAVQGQAPQIQVTVRPRDAVQWALYYEPVLPTASFEQLAAIPDGARDAMFYVRRAGLLLGAGQLDEARLDLDQAQKLDPASGDAAALRAIVAVALNDKDGGLANGRLAVERAPQSPAARLALSYALQAALQLEAARDAASQATEIAPNDGASWARLAELRLMLDDVGGAVDAARRATMLSPQGARAQTALGFALFAQLKISEARAAFERAVDLEADNPLARLGLGLARIRQGRLSEGRGDLELAVAMNPDSSLNRSYLGKAYVEEGLSDLAEKEFDAAKVLDVDPTPWLYSAIFKQTLNRPVEALGDLQRSIELNDNRAVYRSRFLLDQDAAIRGARLGRIYRDLGFERLALLEGWQSLNTDSASHSAHRLLADTYLVLPQHEVARDSELLQAQLLQPININPVQPRLAHNGLTFLDDSGAAGTGFNEFTRLFAVNQVRLVADGIGGSFGTAADNIVLSGIVNRASFSVGQFHYQTDGIRPNNDARQNIYNAFLQVALSQKTSVHFEARASSRTNGDRRLLFNPETFQTSVRELTDLSSVRIGFRQSVTPTTIVLASYIHGVLDSDFDTGFGVQQVLSDDSDFAEVRILQQWKRLNVTSGVGYYDATNLSAVTFAGMAFPTSISATRHVNGYGYATILLPKDLTVIAGLSGDRVDSDFVDRHQVNPKLGFAWLLGPKTTLRGATFRALRRTLVSSQTIEPTQVAGFNQFFADADSTDSWRHGVALDRAFTDRLFAGTELSMRELAVPTQSFTTGAVVDTKRVEKSLLTYLYASLSPSVSLVAEHTLEKSNRDALGRNEGLLSDATRQELAGEIRMFAGPGFFGRFRAAVVDEEGGFQDARALIVRGTERFWVADASVGYRLPRQRGVVTVEGRNLFDNSFRFQAAAPEESLVQPRRSITARLTLAL